MCYLDMFGCFVGCVGQFRLCTILLVGRLSKVKGCFSQFQFVLGCSLLLHVGLACFMSLL